jgi:hypothetical protein
MCEAAVERRLSAASLSGGKINFSSEPSKHANDTHSHFGKELINQTGYEERDFHMGFNGDPIYSRVYSSSERKPFQDRLCATYRAHEASGLSVDLS